MAALIGDFVPDLSRFHSIISGSASIQQHQGPQHSSHGSPSPSSSSAASASSSSASSAAVAAAAYRPSARSRPSSAALSAPRYHKADACAQNQQTATASTALTTTTPTTATTTTATASEPAPDATATTTASAAAPAAAANRPAHQAQKQGQKPRPRQGQGVAQASQPGARLASSSSASSSASPSSPSPSSTAAAAAAAAAASRFPSPPLSSSPPATTANPGAPAASHGKSAASMAPHIGDGDGRSSPPASHPNPAAAHDAARRRRRHHDHDHDRDHCQRHQPQPQSPQQQQQQQQQQPSPPRREPHASAPSYSLTAAPLPDPGPAHAHNDPPGGSYLVASSAASTQRMAQREVVRIRDLTHIESIVHAELLTGFAAGGGSGAGAGAGGAGGGRGGALGILQDPPSHQVQYEVSGMPIGDIIEMVAALLTKITATNDLQHDAMQRNATHQQQASQSADPGPGGAQMSPLSHSVLAFHGKNVPAITILSYLSRIHKYCPTTYEVFLSLLVYFDRMTERVNDLVVRSEEVRRRASASRRLLSPHDGPRRRHEPGFEVSDSDLADDDDEEVGEDDEDEDDGGEDDERGGDDDDMVDSPAGARRSRPAAPEHVGISPSATYFVVDSFNIHRLIIAGVTCASKFFSDVFYTNSRYAKVGGLPLAELNHLEIQFLVLNDFRLAVPVEDLETYATMLVEFYAREVVAPRSRRAAE